MVKATYGTGSFVVLNMGKNATLSEGGLVTSVCCDEIGSPEEAAEKRTRQQPDSNQRIPAASGTPAHRRLADGSRFVQE